MPRRPNEKLPADPSELEGITKAAVLLLALGQEDAAAVLKRMSPEMVEAVTRELASLGRIPPDLSSRVVEEFYNLTIASQYAAEGNLDYAKSILENSLDSKTAERVLQQIQTQVQKKPFSFLQRAESENLLTFIQDEHPQTIALILCHLPHHKAAEILVGLPMQKQIEVIKRVANMEQTNPDVIKEVERGLESRLANMLMQSMEKAGGVPTVAEILNLADRATEKTIMEGLEAPCLRPRNFSSSIWAPTATATSPNITRPAFMSPPMRRKPRSAPWRSTSKAAFPNATRTICTRLMIASRQTA